MMMGGYFWKLGQSPKGGMEERSVHNRYFVRKYISWVYWRGVWLSVVYSAYGIFIGGLATLSLLPIRSQFISELNESQKNLDYSDVSEILLEMFGEYSQGMAIGLFYFIKIFITTHFLILFPLLGMIIGLVFARFRTMQLLAEAEMLVALSEIADRQPTDNKTGKEDMPTGYHWLQWPLSFSVPVLIFAVCVYGYFDFRRNLAAPNLVGVYSTNSPNHFVMEFDKVLERFGYLQIIGLKLDPESDEGVRSVMGLFMESDGSILFDCEKRSMLVEVHYYDGDQPASTSQETSASEGQAELERTFVSTQVQIDSRDGRFEEIDFYTVAASSFAYRSSTGRLVVAVSEKQPYQSLFADDGSVVAGTDVCV